MNQLRLSILLALQFVWTHDATALSSLPSSLPSLPPSFNERCETEMPKPDIVIRTEHSGYQILNHVSYRFLTERGMHAYSSEKFMAMTDIKSVIEVELDGAVLEDKQGEKECLAPRIDVLLRYNPMKVFIAREFPELSCTYREMLKHEMHHVQLYQEQLPLVAEVVRAALVRRFGSGPFYAKRGEAKADLNRELVKQWVPVIRAELNKIEALQRKFDSAEESFRLSNSCFGETSKYMGSFF